MLTPAPRLAWARVNGGYTAVLDRSAGQWQMLDPAGTRIWEAITLRGGVEGLADELAVATGTPPAAMHDQVRDFVTTLREAGLLIPAPRGHRSRWSR